MRTRQEVSRDIETAIRMFQNKHLDIEVFIDRLQIYANDLKQVSKN